VEPIIIPTPHCDPWIDLLRSYVTEAVAALVAGGVHVEASWLDPANPRDATLRFRSPYADPAAQAELALVWDEETGWRRGQFVSGAPGRRTVLRRATYLGGDLLPTGAELAYRVRHGLAVPPIRHRDCTRVRDGLDEALLGRGAC
jgi:hypothetical protein